MKLYLMQHGEALPKEVDVERSLSEQGRSDVGRTADFLRSAGIEVARVAQSGKTRARQSAEILASAVLRGGTPELLDGIDPKDPVMPFADLVSVWDEDSLVVGHLPFMSRAVCLLLTGDEEHAAVDFRPGSLVCLEREEGGPWGLAWMVRPELFPG
jgi:phosphohistidine phosphatase